MINKPLVRLAAVAALVLLVHVGYLLSRNMPDDFRSPRYELKEMPLKLGAWVGEEIPMKKEITGAIDADDCVDRLYRDPTGRQISLHANAVMRYFLTLKHHPRHCYTTHGSRLVKEKEDELKMPDGSTVPVGIMLMENQGQRILVLYWYQLDVFPHNDNVEIALDHPQQRKLRWKLHGQKTWPPLVKVLLQTPAPEEQSAERRIKEFAARVYGWTKYLDPERLLPADGPTGDTPLPGPGDSPPGSSSQPHASTIKGKVKRQNSQHRAEKGQAGGSRGRLCSDYLPALNKKTRALSVRLPVTLAGPLPGCVLPRFAPVA